MDQYEVFPKGDGWNYRVRKAGKSAGTGDGFGSRSEAIGAARAASDGELRLVLLRKDGSMVGELDGPRSSGAAQRVDVEAANETGDAN